MLHLYTLHSVLTDPFGSKEKVFMKNVSDIKISYSDLLTCHHWKRHFSSLFYSLPYSNNHFHICFHLNIDFLVTVQAVGT